MRLLLMAILGTFTLTSCGESEKKNAEDASMPMQNEMHAEHDKDMQMSGNLDDGSQQGEIKFKNEQLGEVYNHYMHIKTALVNSNAEEAQSGGKLLAQALQNLEGNPGALGAAQEIAQTEDINEQRTDFSTLSAEIEKMVSGQIESGAIYKQFCPMAFEGEGGYWLSASQEVRNPYYGDKMLKCGSVRDTIQ